MLVWVTALPRIELILFIAVSFAAVSAFFVGFRLDQVKIQTAVMALDL